MLKYLNAASHGLPDRAVLNRMSAHLELEARIGPLAAVAEVDTALQAVRSDAETLLNAEEETLGFATGTLSAWHAYVAGLSIAGKRLLVAPHEWGENIAALQKLAAKDGATIEVLPLLDMASPDLRLWQDRIDDDVAAIFLPMVSSVSGLHYPVEAIGALRRPLHTQIIVDAAQAIGQVDIDVRRLGCDALFATTRKWVCGPRQTAIFWTADADRRIEIERLDTNATLRLGLGVALRQLLERGLDQTKASLLERSTRIREHADRLNLECLSVPHGGTTAVTVLIPEQSVAKIDAALNASQIIAKWPNALEDEPFSQFQAIARKPLRLAPHLLTSIADIDAAFDVIAAAL